MSTYRLDRLFAPRSIAVVGGSPRDTSPGRAVLKNLSSGGFAGEIHLVNSHYDSLEGIAAVESCDALSGPPDIVVIGVPPAAVSSVVRDAAAKGAAVAIILTAGLGHGPSSLAEQCEQAARAHGMRLVGPNCLGVLAPPIRLNASFAASTPQPGDLALVSQSGAIATGLVEWAAQHGIGFSGIVSIGDSIDVDFADLLDHFAVDRNTRAILLYVESIRDARKFMSAARAAARAKPVRVIKSGRHAAGAKAALTHTGALAGSDTVYDAAFRRAGFIRVVDLDELFAAAETLGHVTALAGSRLSILTNGGGIGVLAVDRLADLGGSLADISTATMDKLDAALPPIWSRANPVDIAGDADANRYAVAIDHLLEDDANDRRAGHECTYRARLGRRCCQGGGRRDRAASQARLAATFGPVIVFGQGGTAVEVIDDKALALPPLDLALVHGLIARTRVARILKAYRNVPAADEAAIALLLVKLSQLAADFPEIREVDLNPVLADETGVIAVDARISIAAIELRRPGPLSGNPRFAIRPYPKDWERHLALPNRTKIFVRPIRPEDEMLYPAFLAAVAHDDLRLRFFAPVKEFSHSFIARFTQIDYARAMAFIAIEEATSQMLGVVRIHADSEYRSAEYAILVRSDLKGHGLGWLLMELMIEYARAEGLETLHGQVLRENSTMLQMCRQLGFQIRSDLEDSSTVVVTLPL